MPSKMPSKMPPRKQTMEVQMGWLESVDESQVEDDSGGEEQPVSSGRKRPPRLPGAAMTLPPMPVITQTQHPPPLAQPKRNHTMEVEMNWVELIEEKKEPKRRASQELKRASAQPPSQPLPIEEAIKPRAKSKRPIRREDD